MTTAVEKPRIALNNILFTTDFSDASRHALPFAAAMARRYDAHLLLAHVVEQIPMSAVPMDSLPQDMDRAREHAERKMQEFRQSADLVGLKLETMVEPGFLWPVVTDTMEQRKTDMIVLGTHGRGPLKRLLLGSAAEEIFRHATCPVLTIGPNVDPKRATAKLEKILFATDFSSGSIHALDYALKLVADNEAQLLMIHVVQASAIPFDITDDFVAESEAKLKDMIAPDAMPTKPPLFLTLIGIPSEQILNFAERENADLIVMGVHKGTELASHWPLEFAAKIIAGAKCPVLSVRGSEAEKRTVRRTVDPTSLP
jgi:nucleotide-binding universal stress UspA family protein